MTAQKQSPQVDTGNRSIPAFARTPETDLWITSHIVSAMEITAPSRHKANLAAGRAFYASLAEENAENDECGNAQACR
jgi:hypothetical protein